MDAGGDRLHGTNIAVIREVYDSEYSQHGFSIELEKALHAKCSIIIIEPTPLGDETARWITFGNYIHKTAVLSGLASHLIGFFWPKSVILQGTFCTASILTTALYTASWQFDHCVKYQVERDRSRLARLPILGVLTTTTPVVLVRKDDTRRKILHCTVSLTAAAFCIYKLYHTVK
ncbi:transmembrane protein 11-A, mitochondrial [Coccinella septempunctata]|uniref:transmembrane protein 11-A, mitochondrial n=1 Tax=Coccinella septempunctata TaxID=41139 RepID=UPI001D09427A|nr:transmembrane protein 11-A, mitochondrial [Coccinella septempunctata]XP_044750957.1 transmembrane protein 11-A, mitochondrial [Coccinella septempunctata]